jgi:hypothetical protein
MVRISGRLAGFVVAVAMLAVPGPASAAIVNNGDFETGDLSGWQMVTSSPNSGWFAYSGTSAPVSLNPIPAPPQGNHAAISDETGAGLHVLYQDITLPTSVPALQLSLLVYYDSQAPIASPNSLDFSGGANQQYRVDVMKPDAPLDSVDSSDVLRTVFRTLTGDPETLSPTQKTADLTPFAGQTVRIRLAEVDNQLFYNAGADVIAVKSNEFTVGTATRNKKKGTATIPVTVPEAGTLSLTGNGVKPSSATKAVAVGAGTTNLLVKATGKKKRKLQKKGKVTVSVTITYTPTGISANSQQATVKLKKKRKKK